MKPDWSNEPFLDERTEDPGILVQEIKKALYHWTVEGRSARQMERRTQRFLEEVTRVSPREAFRIVAERPERDPDTEGHRCA